MTFVACHPAFLGESKLLSAMKVSVTLSIQNILQPLYDIVRLLKRQNVLRMQATQLLESSSTQPIDWIRLARQGISKQLMLQVQSQMELSQKEIADLLHLTPRTLQRMDEEQLLPPASSGHLLELARLYRRAVNVLGSASLANQWLRTTIPALNNVQPVTLLDTPAGIQWVSTVLGRIEYGVYS